MERRFNYHVKQIMLVMFQHDGLDKSVTVKAMNDLINIKLRRYFKLVSFYSSPGPSVIVNPHYRHVFAL